MKSILPWLLAVAFLGAAALFFSTNRKLAAEVQALRAESAQAQTLRAEVEQLKTAGSPAQAEEIAQLKKNTAELLKLRNENRQLRDAGKELEKTAQSAQAREQAARAEATAAASQAQAALAHAQSAERLAEHTRLTAQATPATQQLNTCINNLRQIDGAKHQWALENRKTAADLPTAQEVTTYLKEGIPGCPAGGRYTLNKVESSPTCSIPGHALPVAAP